MTTATRTRVSNPSIANAAMEPDRDISFGQPSKEGEEHVVR